VSWLWAGCSALLSFDTEPTQREEGPSVSGDGGDPQLPMDGAVQDGSRELPPDAGEDGGSPLLACMLATHAGCAADHLCCDHGDGRGPRCVDTSGSAECAACGQPCTDPAAPHCGDRACECVEGSGQACAPGQACLGSHADARCVECVTDDDCRGHANGTQCVAERCQPCDRGPLSREASDDEGCSDPRLPICDDRNRCAACSIEPDNCPGDQVCNGALGCLGCDLQTPLDTRNCGGTRPICRARQDGSTQCDACANDQECGGGFCDNRPGVGTGACTTACAPAAALGENGCPASAPFCRQLSGSGFACRPCAASDCGGQTPYCMTAPGPHQGQCVTCRNNADCAGATLGPVCDEGTRSCRPRQAADCAAPHLFDDARRLCLQCREDADCGSTTSTPFCGADNTCRQCEVDADCSNAATPLCLASTQTCVPCNLLDRASADARCGAKAAGSLCATQGPTRGRCGECDPGREGATNASISLGCADALPRCAAAGGNAPTCHECDPQDAHLTCEDANCVRVGDSYRCVEGNGNGRGR
jgi:hypothetical protein